MIYDRPIELIFTNTRDITLRNDQLSQRYRVRGNILDTNRSDIRYVTNQIIKLKSIRKARILMKVYSNVNNDGTVKVMIKNPMRGKTLARKREMDIDYITNVKVKTNDKLIYNVNLTSCISKNPFFKFSYKDITPSFLTLEYSDNYVSTETVGAKTIKVSKKNKITSIPKPLKPSKNPKIYPNKIESIKKLFGDITLIEDGIQLKAPKIASNQGAILMNIHSNIKFKSIALFVNNHYSSHSTSNYSDCDKPNQFSLVSQWFSTPYSIADFDIKIKMRESGELLVVLEAENGKYYTIRKKIIVAIGGGCVG